MTALLPVIIANLPQILQLGEAGFNFVVALRSAAKQSNAWTADMESAFVESLIADAQSRAWKTNAQVGIQ